MSVRTVVKAKGKTKNSVGTPCIFRLQLKKKGRTIHETNLKAKSGKRGVCSIVKRLTLDGTPDSYEAKVVGKYNGQTRVQRRTGQTTRLPLRPPRRATSAAWLPSGAAPQKEFSEAKKLEPRLNVRETCRV